MRPASDDPASEAAKPRDYFATTQWTMVLNAGRSDSTCARNALAQLCQTYWYPLYAYVRRRGNSPEDAEDLTQGFFTRLLELNSLADVRREKGKFRSFLLVVPILSVVFRKFTTAAAWGKIFEPPMHRPALGVAVAFGAFAASGCVVALLLAAKAIQVFVWEDVPFFANLLGCVFPLFYFFFSMLMEVVRQQRRIAMGPRPEGKAAPLSPEQLAPIHEAIFAGRTLDAIQHYRAATGANGSQGLADIVRMETALKLEQPEKFSAEALNRPIARTVFWNWLFLVSSLLMGLAVMAKHSPWLFFWLLDGIVAGGFIRLMSSNSMGGGKGRIRGCGAR